MKIYEQRMSFSKIQQDIEFKKKHSCLLRGFMRPIQRKVGQSFLSCSFKLIAFNKHIEGCLLSFKGCGRRQ